MVTCNDIKQYPELQGLLILLVFLSFELLFKLLNDIAGKDLT